MTLIYTYILLPLLILGLKVLSFFDPKIKEGLVSRKGKPWIKPFSPGKPWVWFHVSSGELEYAKPVMEKLKAISQYRILVTYFSPSAVKNLQKTPTIDMFVPMPWDSPWHWKEFLNHYKPVCLAIARTDTWPNMVWQSRKYNLPSLLFAATLPSHSGRAASFWGRLLYGTITDDLSFISCVSEEDLTNFKKLSEDVSISVDGDTRFDQVITRVKQNRPLKELNPGGPTFVIGSSWPEDEKVVLPATLQAIQKGLKVVIAPHEPTTKHLEAIESFYKNHNLTCAFYSQISEWTGQEPVLVIDQIGILADLYRLGSIAFVGNSFKKAVHSVMEPAASGCLTTFGPFHYNNREAIALKKQNLAVELRNSQDLEALLLKEISLNTDEKQKRSQDILSFVNQNAGVSEKVAQWISHHSKELSL